MNPDSIFSGLPSCPTPRPRKVETTTTTRRHYHVADVAKALGISYTMGHIQVRLVDGNTLVFESQETETQNNYA
jgi:hypothetical protein